jgi:uncharacterized protein involved in type VI secretion and phage assembly
MARLTRESGQPQQGSGFQTQLVVGLVTENVDPEEKGRIQVSFPTLPGNTTSYWIRQASPNAGELRGFYALPEKNDEVLVAFLQGNPAAAVIVGQLWNGVDVPPAEAKDGLPGPAKTDTGATWSTEQFTEGSTSLDGNDRRFWRSRSGHLFVFDDTDGKESVQVWDKDHNLSIVFDTAKKLVTIANTQGDLHIRTKQDLYLEAGRDIKIRAGQHITTEAVQNTSWKAGMSLAMESGMDTTQKAGTEFGIEAGTSLTAKGKVSTTLEGGVSMKVKGGATASYEGGALAELKAGMVKIN